MSVFETPRQSDNSQTRLDKARQTAIARKLNRRKLYEERILAEQAQAVSESLTGPSEDTVKESQELDRRSRKQFLHNRNRALYALESRLVTEGYKKCFNNAIFEIVYEGFWADDDVKEKTVQTMYATYENVLSRLDELGIKPVAESQYNRYLSNVKEIVTEACKKASKRIAETAAEGDDTNGADEINSIKFGLTSDESQELDDNLAELNPEDMSALVKNKVLQVIQDEQIAGAKKSDAFKEIDEMKKSISSELKDEAEAGDGGEMPEEGDTATDEPAKESVSLESAILKAKARKLNRTKIGSSLFECLMMGSAKAITENALDLINGATKTEVMDAAFMESVLIYTILETVQTVGLFNFTASDIRTIANHYKSV